MSQWGAYGFAQHGATYDRILAHYYTGTELGQAPVARVRVLLAQAAALTSRSRRRSGVRDGAGEAHARPRAYAFGPGLGSASRSGRAPRSSPAR